MSQPESRWEISLTRQAEKTLYRLSKNLLQRLDQVILALAANPRPPKAQQLPGHDNLYRLYMDDWRIAYAVEDERLIVLILEIAPKQQPERYRLEEELEEGLLPEETKIAKVNLPEAFFKAIKANLMDQERLKEEFVRFVVSTRREKIRLLIVDHLPESREYLEALVLSQPDMEVVGTATSGEEAIQKAAELQPDMVLMDTSLSGRDGITACEEIVKQMPSVQVILMSAWGTDDYVRRAMVAGAKEYLVKPFSADELLRSIRGVYQKRERFSPAIAAVQAKIRLLIVDDIGETRENLRKLLYLESDIEIVGAATNGEEAIQMAVERQPDVVLMDIIMPGINGLTATEIISQEVPSAQVIMMSVQGEADYLRRAMLAGAKEFLIKPFSSDELMTSIRRVYQSAALQKLHAPPKIAPSRDDFKDLKARIQGRLIPELDPTIDVSRPNELGRTILRDRFEQILTQENIILSQSERTRLFESIVAEILQTELDETQKRALAQWFKFFKLGNKVEISLSVADLSKSLSFYEKLGLDKVDSGEKPYLWAVVSDGRFYLGLHQQVFSSPTLSYFTLHGLSERMDHLPKLGIRLDNIQKLAPIQSMQNNELLYGLKFITAEFASPEGQRVLLADLASEVETTPTGRKFFSKYEVFGELSLNTKDVKAALAYWEKLGFGCVAEGNQPYPWAIVSDGRIRLGFHQNPKLTQPTITYFAPDMPDRLKRLRRRGIKFMVEHKDKKGRRVGAVIESPDGQLFFLFAGEIKSQTNGQNRSGIKAGQEADEENRPRPEGAQWYKIYTYEGYESKVQKNLLQQVEAMGLQDKILQVVMPPVVSSPIVFPSYILVEMIFDEDSWYVVSNTPGVTGFGGSGSTPTPLRPDDVDRILKR